MPKRALSCLIIALGCMGLALKALALSPPPVSSDALLDRVSRTLESKGLLETGRTSLTSDSTYRAARYATIACREALIVLPLLRNGEFKGLVDDPNFPIAYIVDGVAYRSFPTVRLWRETLLTRIGLSSSALPPVAVVADPTCVPKPAQLLR